MPVFLRYFPVIVGLMLFAGFAHAQTDTDNPWAKFEIAVGGFLTTTNTDVQVNSSTGLGVNFDVENVLGVETSKQTYRIDASYRFGESRRNEIEVHYFNNKRDGSKTLDEDLTIGDVTFTAGTGVSTEVKLAFFNVDYVYNVLMDDRVRLGLSAGLHTTGIKLNVAEIGGGQVENEDLTAPLPMLGVRLDVVLAKHWKMKTYINLFYLEYDSYTGRLADTFVGVEYAPWKHVGLGLGVNAINYYLDADSDSGTVDLNGSIEFQLTGLAFYAKYFF